MLPMSNNRTLSQRKKESSTLYLPAVYRYTCLGIFSASTEERGSAGHCKGMRSSIVHIIDMDPMTREEALKAFIGDDSMVASDENNVGLAIEDGRTNPALIYPPTPLANNNNNNNPSSKGIGNENEEDRVVVVEPVGASEVVQVDNKIQHESFSAFGSTDVHCLQLTDLKNGSTEIVALGPNNAGLVSTRKIVMDDRRITSTEIGLDPYKMAFLVETTHVKVDQSNDGREQVHHTAKRSEESSVAAPDAAATTHIIPMSTMESARQYLEQGHAFSGRVYDFSLKMVDQMYHQTDWLKRNIQDDFFARTVASGNRMIAEMPRTVSIFGKVFRSLFGADNNDDHHDD